MKALEKKKHWRKAI